MKKYRHVARMLLALLLLTGGFDAWSQDRPDGVKELDSLLVSTEEAVEAQGPREGTSLEESIRKTQKYTIQVNGIHRVLNRQLDTVHIESVLPRAEQLAEIIESRLTLAQGQINLRYVNALNNLLRSVKGDLLNLEKNLDLRVDELLKVKLQLDSLRRDPLLSSSIADTNLLPVYQQALRSLQVNVQRSDSALNVLRFEAAVYQTRLSVLSIKLNELDEQLVFKQRVIERAIFQKETNYMWERSEAPSSLYLYEILQESLRFNAIIMASYLMANRAVSIVLLLLIGLLFFWLRRNLLTLKANREFAKLILQRTHYVPRNPILTSVLIVVTLAPFVYTNLPVSFFTIILTVQVLISGLMLRRRLSDRVFLLWTMLFMVFLVSIVSNLFWQVSHAERWPLFVIGVVGIGLTIRLLHLMGKYKENLPTYVTIATYIYIGLQGFSLFANMLGRFSLAKMIGITATMSLLHAISLIVFVVVVKEIIYLQIEVSRDKAAEFTSYLDFNGIQKRVIRFFSLIAVIIWAYYFFDNLSAVNTIFDAIGGFLAEPRKLLNASFTFESIVLFILIVYIASLLANNIAYFAQIKDRQHARQRDKRLGSQILLIRLAVLSLGFLIAVAASGIPLDKVALVLGALSVGIGFGLQSIVNNLVSGVILAFERPIQIGDTIQLGAVEGIVQDIGVRASKIKNWDGAEVIIPNGDLLAQHLTNWTLSDKKRRVELIIGVSFHSDTDSVTTLIAEALKMEEILKIPEPLVFLQTVREYNMDFRVLFWVSDFEVWLLIRDKVMRAIYQSFKDKGIEIPFPQRDLHIKSMPGLVSEVVKSPREIASEKSQEKKSQEKKSDQGEDIP